jgi:AraC-binding-like domain
MFASPPVPDARQQLLDAYPLIRSRSTAEARDLVGRALSPHHLQVRTDARAFEARHNQIRLHETAINVLSYGAEVEIDPGERGDYYLLQLPLQGRARVRCNDQEAWVHPEVMSVLQPRARTRMVWSSDCAMIMLQVPSQTLRAAWQANDGPLPALRLTRSRQDPAVAAWWQALGDMTRNLHQHGAQWLRHPAAFAAMEGFLISGLDLLRPEGAASGQAAAPLAQADSSRLQRAVDHIHAHAHEGLTLASIAAAACMSPRAGGGLPAPLRHHPAGLRPGCAAGTRAPGPATGGPHGGDRVGDGHRPAARLHPHGSVCGVLQAALRLLAVGRIARALTDTGPRSAGHYWLLSQRTSSPKHACAEKCRAA